MAATVSFLLLLVSVISGVAAGGLLWAVENYLHIYLVVAFPIIAGAIAGGLMAAVVRATKVRNPLVTILFGIIAGLLMYGVYHVASYVITFRNDARSAYIEALGKTPTDAELDKVIEAGLQAEVKDTGFIG